MSTFVKEAAAVNERYRIECGDARTLISAEPDASVDCVVTSPPFWRVRDFGHEDQIGMEKVLDDYLDNLIALFREIRRVLKPHGTVWVEMGDAYNNGVIGRRNREDVSIGTGPNQDAARRQSIPIRAPVPTKSMIALPWRFCLRMLDDGWILRNVVVWARTSPLPEPVTDRLTRGWTPVFMFVKSARYYFDLDDLRIPQVSSGILASWSEFMEWRMRGFAVGKYIGNPLGRNPGDVWVLGYDREEADADHPARFPEALAVLCLIAGCPPQVCASCGAAPLPARGGMRPSCACNAGSIPGLAFDPFCGSGTVPAVALRLGYRALAYDIVPAYCAQTRQRCTIAAQQVPIYTAGAGRQKRAQQRPIMEGWSG
jgi:site-specific DNA-methyltransferase (adenine-specific)